MRALNIFIDPTLSLSPFVKILYFKLFNSSKLITTLKTKQFQTCLNLSSKFRTSTSIDCKNVNVNFSSLKRFVCSFGIWSRSFLELCWLFAGCPSCSASSLFSIQWLDNCGCSSSVFCKLVAESVLFGRVSEWIALK